MWIMKLVVFVGGELYEIDDIVCVVCDVVDW